MSMSCTARDLTPTSEQHFLQLMKEHEIPEQDRKCLNCRFCMMHDSTCALPENNFKPINYDDKPCQQFETEALYTPTENLPI